MTPISDDLGPLWSAGGGRSAATMELLADLERLGREFDRKIRLRDLREVAAGALVTVIYLWFAAHERTWFERGADLWLAACGVWISLYLLRYSRASRKPSPERSLVDFQQGLTDRYDRQIELLKAAKYWYVLPFWVGLVLTAAAHWNRTHNALGAGILIAFATLVNAGLWWLNEVAGVRYLRAKRDELAK